MPRKPGARTLAACESSARSFSSSPFLSSPTHRQRRRCRRPLHLRPRRLKRRRPSTTRSGGPSRSGTGTIRIRWCSAVLLSGRFHYDYAAIDADQGDHDEWNVRRLRIGPRITLFRTLTLHSEVELDPQRRDPFYVRFTDFYVQWTKSSRMVLTVGKQSAPFTVDGATSSRELLTIDRSNLANNIWFPQEYLPGVSVSGRRAPWVYPAALDQQAR